jgi:formylglycine-generating enzyme required for sulfatase activity
MLMRARSCRLIRTTHWFWILVMGGEEMRRFQSLARFRVVTLAFISYSLFFLSSCGWMTLTTEDLNLKSTIKTTLKIQKDSIPSSLVINEGSTLVVYFLLSSALSSESRFNLVLEGSSGETSSQYFNLSQNTLTIPSGQTSAFVSIIPLDDSIYHNQSHWSLKLVSQSPEIESTDSLEFDLKDNDSNPSLAPTAILTNTPSNPSNATALNITVGGTNVDFYRYKVGPSLSTFCNVNVGYISDTASSIHILDNLTGFADGSLTLCVLGRDSSGNIQPFDSATSYTWIKDTSAPTAILTGAPTGTNNTTSLNVVVSGTDVVYYQFKIGETSSTVCSNATGYSSDIAVAQSIQSNISALANGGVTLCVIGKDSGGNYQSMASSTTAAWIKDTVLPTISSVSSALANGAYKAGTQVDLSVVFSKVVFVNGGTPSLDLNSGIGAKANYLSGSNSTTLVFRYIVGAGDSSTDLNYPLTTSLVLNGATIRDSSGNNANLNLPGIGGGNDLGSLKNIYIDTTAPNPPTGLAGGTWTNSTSQSPTLTFTSGTDGQSGIASHEVKIYDTTTTTEVTTFATIASGNSISGLSLTDGHTYTFVMRTVDAAGNYSSEVSSGGWTVDTTPPTAPGVITTGSVPANFKQVTPTFTFTESSDAASGLSHYIVEIRKQSDSSVVKAYATAIGNGAGLSYSEGADFLTGGETYFANIKAVDVAGNQSTATQTLTPWIAINCPTNFIAVPARSPYTSLGFCVAKFEMKVQGQSDGNIAYNATNVAESRPDGTPWVTVTRAQAIAECQALGAGYDLITNAQWQSIAQNAELKSTNWTSGTAGSEMMYRGHTDNSPASALAVSDTADKYNGTSNTGAQTYGSGKEQRRSLDLSNGSEIWDLSGNVWEWVKDDNTTIFGTDNYWSQITDVTNPVLGTVGGLTGTEKYLFGPSGSYGALGSTQYGGLGYGWVNYNAGAVLRGGDWDSDTYGGVFYVNLIYDPSYPSTSLGFRCALAP